MIYYLSMLDNIPFMVYTHYEEAIKISSNVVKFELETNKNEIYIIHPSLIFTDLLQSIDYAISHDYDKVYIVKINEYDDPDVVDTKTLRSCPLDYISSMELKYRMINKLSSEDAFKEAYNLWKLYGTDEIEMLKELCEKYPKNKEYFEEHFRQHSELIKNTYSTREEMISKLYV